MKESVIEFLANGKGTPQEKFNKALELYRKTKDHDPQVLRFKNAMGFTSAGLDDLCYELKKANKVTDLEVANAKKRPARKKVEKTSKGKLLEYIDNVNQVDLTEAKDEALEEIISHSIGLMKEIPEEEVDEEILEYAVKLQNIVTVRQLEIFNDFFGIKEARDLSAVRASMESLDFKILKLTDALALFETNNEIIEAYSEESDEVLKEAVAEFGNRLAECNEAAAQEENKDLETVEELLEAYKKMHIKWKNEAEKIEVNDAEIVGDKEAFEKGDKTVPDAVENKPADTPDASTPLSVTKEEGLEEKYASTPLPVTKNETSEEKTGTVTEAVQEEIDEAEEEVKKVIEELKTFDEKTSYNDVKSFAARLAKVVDSEPKDQKAVTLKAFIEEARKKYVPGK